MPARSPRPIRDEQVGCIDDSGDRFKFVGAVGAFRRGLHNRECASTYTFMTVHVLAHRPGAAGRKFHFGKHSCLRR